MALFFTSVFGTQPSSTGTIGVQYVTEVEVTLVHAVSPLWDTNSVVRPRLVIREESRTLWEDIPKEGVILFYGESDGIRRNPQGSWAFVGEVFTIACDMYSLQSIGHLEAMKEELVRVVETMSYGTAQYHTVRVVSSTIKYSQTSNAWIGEVRVEMSRGLAPTAYVVGG